MVLIPGEDYYVNYGSVCYLMVHSMSAQKWIERKIEGTQVLALRSCWTT